MKSSILLGLLVFFLGVGPALAQGARMCAPTNAERTTVAAIAADPAAWIGKCVTMQAIYSSEQLYADADAIYGVSKNIIGGFADGKGTIEGFWTGQFTGRVADCATAERELALGLLRSPGISVNGRTMGCLEPKGPFLLFMSQRDLKPVTFTRRLAPAKGDLLAVAASDEFMDARRIPLFLKALQAGDRKALSTMSGADDYAVERLFADDTALADLRKPVERPMQVFKVIEPKDDIVTVVCWCRTKDCSKKWPIALRDADNQPSRPYACVRERKYQLGRDQHGVKFDASQDFGGLPEPG
jgi:hypothetical protein